MPCTVLPVRDDLSGWCTMSHWWQKKRTNKWLYLEKVFIWKEHFEGTHKKKKSLPWQDLPAWQWVMWLRTFFMVRQWGSEQALTSPLACSRRWHLCAWSNRTSCCWMSLRFSGSAVGPADTPPTPGTIPTEPTCCCSWGCKRTAKFNQVQTGIHAIFQAFWTKKNNQTGTWKKAGNLVSAESGSSHFFVTILTLLPVYMISWPLLILGIARLSWRERGWRDAIYVMVKNVTMRIYNNNSAFCCGDLEIGWLGLATLVC